MSEPARFLSHVQARLDRTASEEFLPLSAELRPAPDAEQVFRRLCRRPRCLFLDSALRHPGLGRYSFVTADPFAVLELPADGRDGLAELAQRLRSLPSATAADLPPFQGGAAGLFSYDLGRSLERLPSPRFDEFRVPALSVGFYDTLVALDHQQQRAWIVSQGLPETDPAARRQRALDRIQQFRVWLDAPASDCSGARHEDDSSLPIDALAPAYPVVGPQGLMSNFTADTYCRAIERAVEYIRAGDIFQVNLAQRLLFPARDDAVALYLRLRRKNPATFAGYYDLGTAQIVSASPERFIQVRGREVETRPIKGTRQRTAHPVADLFGADDLKHSQKDLSENVMIVDLLRNDLSRACRPETVRVTQLCELETYEYVQHLVSAVRGELDDDGTALDLVRAAFPGGSITGAPKVRAMEIIAEMEPTARGAYCGALGYVGFDGSMDLNVLIRTITASRGWWQMPVGGGIVALSSPFQEYDETWHKARGLIRALLPETD